MIGKVTAVSRSPQHTMSKLNEDSILLLAGWGVQGDAHAGATMVSRSRWARDRTPPNLRQVHLLPAELHDELRAAGFSVTPGQMGENITTRGIDLRRLPTGTYLHLGETAVLQVTGLRHPCKQLDRIHPGLLSAVLDHDEHRHLIRKAGIMAVVLTDGEVQLGDSLRVELPAEPHQALKPV
jgi:MOSC domain-containing protein YiiM